VIPYYDEGGIQIFHGDCREVLPTLRPSSVDLVLTDPPYGISERTDRKARKRTALARCNDFPAIEGDDAPFDPSAVLRFGRCVLFGANHFADRLPPSPSWVIWDKRAGLTSKRGDAFNDNGDAEMAWTNCGGPVRVISHLWMGMLKASERDDRRVHPTQKPVALMTWMIERFTQPGDLVLDPYMGSGPVARACKNTGRRYIGIEVVEAYCRVAVERLQQEVLQFDEVSV
jgi:site-specific DNA-methyltransferase (adenine-specific)